MFLPRFRMSFWQWQNCLNRLALNWGDHGRTLNGSQHSQMKELRFRADGGVWRVAFAFDPHRAAILLIAADKRGQNERRFYRRFITAADRRFNEHLAGLSEAGDTQ